MKMKLELIAVVGYALNIHESLYWATLDPQCNETDVRLVDGQSHHEGGVEICLNGVWGSVCAERYRWERGLWDMREARVVCQQLGYDGREFSQGFQHIIKNLLCLSSRVNFTTAAVHCYFVKCVCSG